MVIISINKAVLLLKVTIKSLFFYIFSQLVKNHEKNT